MKKNSPVFFPAILLAHLSYLAPNFLGPRTPRYHDTFGEIPRRRTYRNYQRSQIDVAEQEYRTRYKSAPTESSFVGQPSHSSSRRSHQAQRETYSTSGPTVNVGEHQDKEKLISSWPTVESNKTAKLSLPKKALNSSSVEHPEQTSEMGFYESGSRKDCGRTTAEPAYTHNSVTIPCHHIRVGDLLILQGRPCQVIRITTSAATGQHRYLGVDLFTKQLHEESSFISNPSPSVVVQTMLGPVFKQYRVLDIQDHSVVAMTETGDVKQSIPVIDQSGLIDRLSEAFETGRGSVRVLIISDGGRELAVDMKVIHGSRL
ncbi:hypothetical protein Golomagni_01054 [Golovinomyces magnicellulatus]|nr:hypothetical protein Golomagni_01054 [Golovinomyces magnicellulatus]